MTNYELTHPLYLDVQMMYSFLAFLDGGFSLSDEQTSTTANSREKESRGNASLKFPSLFHLFGAEASLDASLASKLENTLEYKAERHRTEASLFNYLYERLRNDNRIAHINDASELAHAQTGQLVEISGRYNGNPLAEVLSLAAQFFSYFEQSEDEAVSSKAGKSAQRSGNPAVRNAARVTPAVGGLVGFGNDPESLWTIKMLKQMNKELETSPVQDLLVTTFGGLKTVLTVSVEYFSGATKEFLREGEVKVMGKLTRSLAGNDQINLSRRTIVGLANDDTAKSIISSFGNSPGVNFSTADPIVVGPAAQILPMAVFV